MSGNTSPGTPKVNRIGLSMADYKGAQSTLCSGCGHDAISSQIVRSFYQLGIEPHRVVKLSGIGCSSKTPAYFLGKAHGLNSVHGRMAAVATGAAAANHQLICLGVSGDGDTASIGLGQFCHLLRRNVPMVYILENNGVYGLTKGQFSATADKGSRLKSGTANELPPIDICMLAIEMGCSYVGRSFAADPKQVVQLLQGAISHRGTAVLDILSPCVTFNDHEGSTKSYQWGKEHEEMLHELDFVPHYEQLPEVEYEADEVVDVGLHDGATIRLRKLRRDYDPRDSEQASRLLRQTRARGEFLTGLIYIRPDAENFIGRLALTETPLAWLPESVLKPGPKALESAMQEFY